MMKNQRLIILLGGLILVLIVLFVVMNQQRSEPVSQDESVVNQPVQEAQPRALVSSEATKDWKTYTSKTYGFSFQYPPNFKMVATEGSSNFDKSFVSVDVGTKEYMDKLKASQNGPGAGGLPLFLRIGADIPKEDAPVSPGLMKPDVCDGDYTLAEKWSINGVIVSKCEGKTLGSFPSIFVMFKKNNQDPAEYTFESMSYDETNKDMIEQILSTFKFLK